MNFLISGAKICAFYEVVRGSLVTLQCSSWSTLFNTFLLANLFSFLGSPNVSEVNFLVARNLEKALIAN